LKTIKREKNTYDERKESLITNKKEKRRVKGLDEIV